MLFLVYLSVLTPAFQGCCVGLISDTHGYFDDSVVEILSRADDLIVHSGI